MSEIPDDAQRSEDGQWWWDGAAWQPVEGDAAAGQLDERAAALVEQGLPPAREQLTDEQLTQFLAEPTVEDEELEVQETEVLAMQDAGDGAEGMA